MLEIDRAGGAQNPMFLGSTGDRTIFQILTRRGIDIAPFSAVR